jgi:hypothetical protein
MKRRLIIFTLCLIVIFVMGIGLGLFFKRLTGIGSAPKVYNTATLLQQVQALSQLVTVKYVMEKVVILEVPPGSTVGKMFAGDSRVLMLAHGIVKGGIDLGRLDQGDLVVSEKRIVIKLPPAQITDAYLDDKQTRVIERKTGGLWPFDNKDLDNKDLEQTARQQAVEDISRAARNSGILKDADERARAQLTQLFLQLGFEKVEFSK